MAKIMLNGKDYSAPSVGGGDAETAERWKTARNINGMMVDGTEDRANYVSRVTTTSNDDKIFMAAACEGFSLVEGAEITVQLQGIPVSGDDKNLELNINNTGSHLIWYGNDWAKKKDFTPNRAYMFRYHSGGWHVVGDLSDGKVKIMNEDESYPIICSIESGTFGIDNKFNYNPLQRVLSIGETKIEVVSSMQKTMYINAENEIALVSELVEVIDKNAQPSEIAAGFFNTVSSRRYKENIKDMTEEEAKRVLRLRSVKYDYVNRKHGTNCYGLIAEEVDEVMNFPVSYDKDGHPKALDYSKFVPFLIKMVQMQQKEIEDLKKFINNTEAVCVDGTN